MVAHVKSALITTAIVLAVCYVARMAGGGAVIDKALNG